MAAVPALIDRPVRLRILRLGGCSAWVKRLLAEQALMIGGLKEFQKNDLSGRRDAQEVS